MRFCGNWRDSLRLIEEAEQPRRKRSAHVKRSCTFGSLMCGARHSGDECRHTLLQPHGFLRLLGSVKRQVHDNWFKAFKRSQKAGAAIAVYLTGLLSNAKRGGP